MKLPSGALVTLSSAFVREVVGLVSRASPGRLPWGLTSSVRLGTTANQTPYPKEGGSNEGSIPFTSMRCPSSVESFKLFKSPSRKPAIRPGTMPERFIRLLTATSATVNIKDTSVPTRQIAGKVTYQDGSNASGARIRLSGASTAEKTTDASGNYTFTASTRPKHWFPIPSMSPPVRKCSTAHYSSSKGHGQSPFPSTTIPCRTRTLVPYRRVGITTTRKNW